MQANRTNGSFVGMEPQERSGLGALPTIASFGKFELLGRLAVGGMAEIFLAREPSPWSGSKGRLVVIKRVREHMTDGERFVDMFFDEARLVMQLKHPNLCHIYEFGEQGGSYFLSMEWIDGKNLSAVVEKIHESESSDGPQPWDSAVALRTISLIASALHYAHQARDEDGSPMGLVHRDVSPHNIMIGFDGTVKLLDFGVARATLQKAHTMEGQIKGKFAYMSPEQCSGGLLDARSDVFSLGTCLYEALTGRPLFLRDTHFETMRAVIEAEVPSIKHEGKPISNAIAEIVKRALEPDPNARYQSALEMHQAIEGVLQAEQRVITSADIGYAIRELFPEDAKGTPTLDRSALASRFSIAPARKRTLPFVAKAALSLCGMAAVMTAVVTIYSLLTWPGVSKKPVTPPSGSVFLLSDADVSDIRIDGDLQVAKLPALVSKLSIGSHHLQYRKDGNDYDRVFEIHRAQATKVWLQGNPLAENSIVSSGLPQGPDATAARPTKRQPKSVSSRPDRTEGKRASLSINTVPWSIVYLGGNEVGTTPIAGLSVDAGRLTVRAVSRDGDERTFRVRLEEGEHKRLSHTFKK